MAKRLNSLLSDFKPEYYHLQFEEDKKRPKVIIAGQKTGRPSKRFTFHQKGLKITGALITPIGKKHIQTTEVIRINHLPTFEQVRIHTKEMLYPGKYRIEIDYKFPSDNSINAITPSRESLPCIDEAEAWRNARLEIRR